MDGSMFNDLYRCFWWLILTAMAVGAVLFWLGQKVAQHLSVSWSWQ